MRDKLQRFLLEYCAYDSEPLHLILVSIVQEKLVPNISDAIKPLLRLFHNRYIDCYFHSGKSGDKYKKVDLLTEEQLKEYVRIHQKPLVDYINGIKTDYEVYPKPEEGGEYFFKTTEEGYKILDEHG